jgi:hypothetical protein
VTDTMPTTREYLEQAKDWDYSLDQCENAWPGSDDAILAVKDLARRLEDSDDEATRLKAALHGLYWAMRNHHYGRMPDAVEKAYTAAATALGIGGGWDASGGPA